MSVTVSAPGKIHLLGEHAVVYGYPAFLTAIDRRIYVQCKRQKARLPDGQAKDKDDKEKIVIRTTEDNKLIHQTINIFKKAFNLDRLPSLEIEITSHIPTGSGLGSSAALAAALIGVLMKFIKNSWNLNKINELAYEAEKIAHGNPSGADNTIVVFGGLVYFRREFDFLKSIWSLPITGYKLPSFVLMQTGKPEEITREMVETVFKKYKKNKREMEEIFYDQEKQTKKLLLSLKTGDKKTLVSAIRKGERNLEKIGVVGKFAERIIREIEKEGGVAKISGAGGIRKGSGMILCYHQQQEKIFTVAKKYALSAFPINLGEEGIRIGQ